MTLAKEIYRRRIEQPLGTDADIEKFIEMIVEDVIADMREWALTHKRPAACLAVINDYLKDRNQPNEWDVWMEQRKKQKRDEKDNAK